MSANFTAGSAHVRWQIKVAKVGGPIGLLPIIDRARDHVQNNTIDAETNVRRLQHQAVGCSHDHLRRF
jgi:hypothetical protein